MLVTFAICFKQHFDTRYLVFYNPSPPRMFLSLYLLNEYRTQHVAIGPLCVTSSDSTWIFCRGVWGSATDCPCDVCCRGLTTCLLHVGHRFGNRFSSNSWAVGLIWWIVYPHFFLYFDICNYICLDTSYHFFWLYLYFVNISSTPVLTFSIDIVFVLPIWVGLTSGIFKIKFKCHTLKHNANEFKCFW